MIPVLFARPDSVYKALPGFDVWDAERDARKYNATKPVIAHPPCGHWGRLRKFCKAPETEKRLAEWALAVVRIRGGVIEHPAYSTLWNTFGLPKPNAGKDEFGGWTLPINQYCFGHPCEKKTWLYIVGIDPPSIPTLPLNLGYPQHCIRPVKGSNRLKIVSKADREHTPVALAIWLRDLVSGVRV